MARRDGNQTAAVRRLVDADPELAAQMVLHAMPAAAAGLEPPLSFRIDVDGLGTWLVEATAEGPARVQLDGANGRGEDFVLRTDPSSLARLAAGTNPLRLMLSRRLRLTGQRRKALALRDLSDEAGLRDLARMGIPVDPDLAYRALAHVIDPEWTRGHRFRVAYELSGDGGGCWVVDVNDGAVNVEGGPGVGPEARNGHPDGVVRTSVETWRALVGGEITPSNAMQDGLTEVEGALPPITLLGRWIDRADGLDGPELEREVRQGQVQQRRAGSWGARVNGRRVNGAVPAGSEGMGDPAHKAERRRTSGDLLTYEELYALWERSNWRAHELDFEVDKQHWLATPTEGQQHMAWTIGSFYVGEERVTADLAPFLLAAPSGEIEAFLATQLVDEARHAVFFDRFAAEVMALSSDDLRGRLQEMEDTMMGAWHFLFDDSLRDVADRIKARPNDLELFVEGIVTYHMVTEGVLAMTGQRTILDYTEEHSIYPGFHTGFKKVEQDEHRHIAFGVRFLRDVCEERPEMRDVVLGTLTRLLPRAAEVFAPPEADSAVEFVSYGWNSGQIYGYAYMALKRRMKAIGIEIPPPEELMPGPIDPNGLDGARETSTTPQSAAA
jgi:ribonucleoside-diphosphate reductase beta chain